MKAFENLSCFFRLSMYLYLFNFFKKLINNQTYQKFYTIKILFELFQMVLKKKKKKNLKRPTEKISLIMGSEFKICWN